MNQMRTRIAVVLAALNAFSCSSSPSLQQPNAVHGDFLIVLPGAQKVEYPGDYDGSVSYQLDVPHPAKEVISEIRGRLERAGWKAEPDDQLNPGMENSHVRGWMDYIDGTKGDASVFLWSAAWSSPRGDRVEYWLKYEYAKDSGPMTARPPLQVNALYFTAPTVNRIREHVSKPETKPPN
jgi:hypothetical protein